MKRRLLFAFFGAVLIVLLNERVSAQSTIHTPEPQTVNGDVPKLSLREIFERPNMYKGTAILHYNQEIKGVALLAEVLSEDGTPTVAVLGGPDCGVHVILDGIINTRFCFSQYDINSGEVGGFVERSLPKAIELNKRKDDKSFK